MRKSDESIELISSHRSVNSLDFGIYLPKSPREIICCSKTQKKVQKKYELLGKSFAGLFPENGLMLTTNRD